MNDTCHPSPTLDDLARSGPDDGVVAAVMRAADAVECRLERELAGIGLSISKFDAIEQLIRAGAPLTLSELADKLSCVRSNVTQLVDRLEADGLVKRGTCPNDRRAVRAMVTSLGVERHAAGGAAIRSVQEELSRSLDPGERQALVRLLDRVSC